MKAYVTACIEDYIAACQKTSETKWGTPLVGFADARHPRGKSLAGCLPLAYLFCNRFFCKFCIHFFPLFHHILWLLFSALIIFKSS